MFGVEWLGGTISGSIGHQLMPPVIAAGLHIDCGPSAFVNNYILHRWTRFQRLFNRWKQLDFVSATERSVLGNDHRGLAIVDAIDNSVGGKASKDHRVRRA